MKLEAENNAGYLPILFKKKLKKSMLDKVYCQIHSENGRPSSVWVWVGGCACVCVCVHKCVCASAQLFIKWCC